jgi:2-oxoglutarate dehydrogenase complex dehydrogenase (E1) component-like enzyme
MRTNVYRSTLFILSLLGLAAGTVQAQPACLTMERSITGCATPGAAVEVTVIISSTCEQAITALGLKETIPAGWTFQGTTSVIYRT